jgi:uncharacterized repeat protein (TIGR03943 family)
MTSPHLPTLGRSMLLFGTSALICKLLLSGQMRYYLSPSFDGLSALSGAVLAVLGAVELWRALHQPRQVVAHAEFDTLLSLGLAAVPLVVGLLLSPRALGTDALGGAPTSRLVLAFDAGPPRAATAPPPKQPIADVGDLLHYLQVAGEGGVGQPVHARGLVAHSDDLPPDEFVLVRYTIVHCVADAQPLGLLVIAPEASSMAADQWVEIDGILASQPRGSDRLVGIQAARIAPTDEPADPYLSAS